VQLTLDRVAAWTAVAAAAVIGVVAAPNYAFAQTPEVSWTAAFFQFVHEQQRSLTLGLTDAVRALRDHGSVEALVTLIGLGFGYGVFHAVGPGHGKAVISAYALTHETRVKRTIALAFLASLVQGVTAIAIVGGLMLLVEGSLRRAAVSIDGIMEPASYGAVLCVGLYLFVHGIRGWLGGRGHRGHDHENHGHIPDPREIERAGGWGRALLIALSVGVRPCSGAVILLILAFGFGLVASGVAAVSAMSLGTGITVAVLALTARSVRWPFAAILTRVGVRAAPVAAGFATAGGAAIAGRAALLLYISLTAPVHPLR
jgi:ABC-type nickel/cobalt efflux system permease component RcnA